MSTAIHTTPTPNTKKDDAMNIISEQQDTINRLLANGPNWQGNVEAHGEDEIRIFDQGASAWFACAISDVAELCNQLDAEREDAYSLWCAETESRELVVVDGFGSGIVCDAIKEFGGFYVDQFVEAGAIGDGYDCGPIQDIALDPDTAEAYALVQWDYAVERNWTPIKGLRHFNAATSARHEAATAEEIEEV